MSGQLEEFTIDDVVVRSFEPRDQAEVSRLYTEGLLSGQIADNDTGADIENINQGYLDEPRNHFWVAQWRDRIVGMIGVAEEQQHTAEIRRLRVDPQFQGTDLAGKLVEVALQHCKRHGYLKVILDTRCSTTGTAVELFDRVGFQHTRTRSVQAKDLLEFYLDLYRPPRSHDEHS